MANNLYDKAFKEQVVLRVINNEATAREIAEEIGVHRATVRTWVREYREHSGDAFPGTGNLRPEDEENRRLRRELADLREENAILKKAAAYFAKNQK